MRIIVFSPISPLPSVFLPPQERYDPPANLGQANQSRDQFERALNEITMKFGQPNAIFYGEPKRVQQGAERAVANLDQLPRFRVMLNTLAADDFYTKDLFVRNVDDTKAVVHCPHPRRLNFKTDAEELVRLALVSQQAIFALVQVVAATAGSGVYWVFPDQGVASAFRFLSMRSHLDHPTEEEVSQFTPGLGAVRVYEALGQTGWRDRTTSTALACCAPEEART